MVQLTTMALSNSLLSALITGVHQENPEFLQTLMVNSTTGNLISQLEEMVKSLDETGASEQRGEHGKIIGLALDLRHLKTPLL